MNPRRMQGGEWPELDIWERGKICQRILQDKSVVRLSPGCVSACLVRTPRFHSCHVTEGGVGLACLILVAVVRDALLAREVLGGGL